MSLPTSGIHNVDQSSRSNMFTQANQAPGLQPGLPLMGMQAMPGLGHPGHPFVLGSQAGMMHLPPGVIATAAEAMATTPSNSRLGSLGEPTGSLRVSNLMSINYRGLPWIVKIRACSQFKYFDIKFS